ncbi:MAG: aspartate kinase [Planctomycetota bacterium]|nr:aspartate kinase [Planctomycetota bacterium]
MPIVVHKFGGTSLGDTERIRAAARRVLAAQAAGNQVVVVVSATGKNTDELISLAGRITENPPSRDLDLLLSTGEQVSVALMSMAIHDLGGKAFGMAGFQLGIKTDTHHTKAKIISINTAPILEQLQEGNIVVAAGFQGVKADHSITTLGRGGSDTTALALAAVLQADQCIINTDVLGVYTTDPRIVPNAHKLAEVSFEEMLELAGMGAGVMHSRSIEIANRFQIPIYVRSSSNDEAGSWIATDEHSPSRAVCGVALLREEARVTISGVPDTPGNAKAIFAGIAAKNIAVDMIVQNAATDGKADISFTVQRNELPETLEVAKEATRQLAGSSVDFEGNVSKVSIVGRGMANTPGVAVGLFEALAAKGINILMITTSEIKVSVLVHKDDAETAVQTIHDAYDLHNLHEVEDVALVDRFHSPERRVATTDEVLRHVGDVLERVVITSLRTDSSQSLLTIGPIPDEPGFAAKIFRRIADSGVSIDLIVQNAGSAGLAKISFSVAHDECEHCLDCLRQLTVDSNIAGPIGPPRAVTKLSVGGVGLRSHTNVARRLFEALARARINVELINTSEVLINVIVSQESGADAERAIRDEFVVELAS